MTVEQKSVSVRRQAIGYDGEPRIVWNRVVCNHQLRSHMLRTLMRNLQLVHADDRNSLLDLAELYLKRAGPTHSYQGWRQIVKDALLTFKDDAAVLDRLFTLDDLLDNCEPYQ